MTAGPDVRTAVQGCCDPGFQRVADEFARNFSERGELGASVCVIRKGRTVVDLWGGFADPYRNRAWGRDTIVVVFSATKGATALCAHILAARGELDLDSPVARYWPRFGTAAKGDITVRMLLNHQAGLPGLSEPVTLEQMCDFNAMATAVAEQVPLWRPGTRFGYHPATFGWLVGEVVRRVSATTVGRFFRTEVAEPLGLDFWIGLPPAEDARVATTVMTADDAGISPRFDEALARREPIQVFALNSVAAYVQPGACDDPQARAAEIPAANGIANARGLASMYSALAVGGHVDDVELVGLEQLVQMGATESAGDEDAVMFEPGCFSAGFEKAAGGRAPLLKPDGLFLSEAAFGHSGFGGSIGFADPQAGFAFGYAMNRHPFPGEGQRTRQQPLIDATYLALGYQSRAGGKWAPASH
jgi:CubicO group peptidase (beta-lactamase class C family)